MQIVGFHWIGNGQKCQCCFNKDASCNLVYVQEMNPKSMDLECCYLCEQCFKASYLRRIEIKTKTGTLLFRNTSSAKKLHGCAVCHTNQDLIHVKDTLFICRRCLEGMVEDHFHESTIDDAIGSKLSEREEKPVEVSSIGLGDDCEWCESCHVNPAKWCLTWTNEGKREIGFICSSCELASQIRPVKVRYAPNCFLELFMIRPPVIGRGMDKP